MTDARPRLTPYLVFLLLSLLAVLAWSRIHPAQVSTWRLEVFPVEAGFVLMALSFRKFPLTPLVYTLIWGFSIILCVGGHYTYAEVPIGNWARDHWHLSRNHYDRVGHFFQGVVPAMIARELLLRTSPVRPGKWLFFIDVSIALAISASYELFEWQTAVLTSPETGTAFLGSQGDVWDAQWDMAMALTGSIVAQALLSRWHDRQLAQM